MLSLSLSIYIYTTVHISPINTCHVISANATYMAFWGHICCRHIYCSGMVNQISILFFTDMCSNDTYSCMSMYRHTYMHINKHSYPHARLAKYIHICMPSYIHHTRWQTIILLSLITNIHDLSISEFPEYGCMSLQRCPVGLWDHHGQLVFPLYRLICKYRYSRYMEIQK